MTNTPVLCKTCKKPKAPYQCGLCEDYVCKSCAQFLETEAFVFLKKVPAELTHTSYCYNCFDDKVAGPLHEYNDMIQKAKDVIVYTKEQTKLTRFLKRKEDPIKVENCVDENEALMKMSFYAAQENFNCIIDVQLQYKKVTVGSHKKFVWDGVAVPITIDPNAIRGH
jgi:hypothetical protein